MKKVIGALFVLGLMFSSVPAGGHGHEGPRVDLRAFDPGAVDVYTVLPDGDLLSVLVVASDGYALVDVFWDHETAKFDVYIDHYLIEGLVTDQDSNGNPRFSAGVSADIPDHSAIQGVVSVTGDGDIRLDLVLPLGASERSRVLALGIGGPGGDEVVSLDPGQCLCSSVAGAICIKSDCDNGNDCNQAGIDADCDWNPATLVDMDGYDVFFVD